MGQSSDPFSILGLPPRFDLSADEINSAHLSRVASVHPDLAQQGQPSWAEPDDDPTALLNEAKRILENPESRADALLRALGGPSKEADRSLPPGFLMEMMETREAVEAAMNSKDPAALQQWRRWADEQRTQYSQTVSALFGALGPNPAPAKLAAIRTSLNAWRYIERLVEQT